MKDVPFNLRLTGRVLLSQYLQIPQHTNELRNVGEALDQLRAQAKQPIILVHLALPENPPPDGPRQELFRLISTRLKNGSIETLHIVMPSGGGFYRATVRAVSAGTLLLLGMRGRAFIHDSFEEALTTLEKLHQIRPEELRRAAEEQKFRL